MELLLTFHASIFYKQMEKVETHGRQETSDESN